MEDEANTGGDTRLFLHSQKKKKKKMNFRLKPLNQNSRSKMSIYYYLTILEKIKKTILHKYGMRKTTQHDSTQKINF